MSMPLVPANVVLRDFAYMPLDVLRLRDSELVSHASGEGFRCAVLLWCVSWHQVPAGSLPNDEIALSNFVGYGRSPKEWKKHRDDALRGWILCSDNRLYHPVVAEKANEAWTERLRNRWRSDCARIKKAAQRAQVQAHYPTFEQWREHFESTGQEQWRPSCVPAVSPGTDEDSPRDVTRDEGTKGSEAKRSQGKGREEKQDLPLPERLPHTPPSAAVSGQFEGHERPAQGANPGAPHAIALNRLGHRCTAMNPDLVAFVEAGGTVQHLEQVAALPECEGKPAAYVIRIARRELTERANPPTSQAGTRNGTPQPRESLVDRNARRAAEILGRSGTE